MADTTSPRPTSPGPRRRWRTWLLIVSLGLNLAVVGMVAGIILRGPPDRAMSGPALWSYARALPEPYRDDLRRALRESRGDWAPSRDALRNQRQALASALVAEPYDPGRVTGLLEEELLLGADLGRRSMTLLAAQIARMSPGDRAAFAERLREPPASGHPGRGTRRPE